MPLSRASTESFTEYHMQFEQLDRLVKVGTAGFSLLGAHAALPNGSKIVGSLVDSAAQPWSKDRNFPNPTATVRDAQQSFIQQSLVAALSLFDWFTQQQIYEMSWSSARARSAGQLSHAHHSPPSGAPFPRFECCSALAGKLCFRNGLGKRLALLRGTFGLSLPSSSPLIPLFEYYRVARNCIAHGASIADDRLEKASHSTETTSALAALAAISPSRPPPAPPKFKAGDSILLEPSAVIQANTVCLRLATDISGELRNWRSLAEWVFLAAHHAVLFDSHPFRQQSHKDGIAAVSFFLFNRSRIRISRSQLISELRNLNLLEPVTSRFRSRRATAASRLGRVP